MRSRVHNQQGAFAIELAFVLAFMVTLFLFCIDLSTQVLNRAKLDRLSYSLVSLVKERQRFFEERTELSETDFNQLQTIAAQMLSNESGQTVDFGIQVDSLIEGRSQSFNQPYPGETGCEPETPIAQLSQLVPSKASGDEFPLYQVTLCLGSDAWFDRSRGIALIRSSSVMAGR